VTYKPNKLSQTELVFGLQSEFISGTVRTELQISIGIARL